MPYDIYREGGDGVFVDVSDNAGNGGNDVGNSLDGLDVASSLTSGDFVADDGQVHEHQVAQLGLSKVGDTDQSCGLVDHLDPLVVTGILQVSRKGHRIVLH